MLKFIKFDKVPILDILQIKLHQKRLKLSCQKLILESWQLLKVLGALNDLKILYDSIERDLKFALKSLSEESFHLVLVLYLLVKDSECNVFEVCNSLNLVFKHDFLRLKIHKKAFILLLLKLTIDHPVSEGELLPFVENLVISLVVSHKHGVNLAIFKISDRFIELNFLEFCTSDLLNPFLSDNVGSFLKVNIFQKFKVTLLHVFVLDNRGGSFLEVLVRCGGGILYGARVNINH